jgi:hypothetical protein
MLTHKRLFLMAKIMFLPCLVAFALVWAFFQAAKAGQAPAAQLGNSTTLFAPREMENGLQVVSSGLDGLVLQLRLPDFEIESDIVDGQPCQALRVPGFVEVSDQGGPPLPVRGALLGIPANASLRIEAIETEVVTLPGRYDLCPAVEPRLEWETDQNEPPRFLGYRAVKVDPAIRFNLEGPVTLVSTGFVRSQRVASLRFQPFFYHPETGELRYYRRILVRVDFLGGSSRSRLGQALVEEGIFEHTLRQVLVNYDLARAWRVPSMKENPDLGLPLTPADNGRAFKLLVNEDGMYRVTYADLQAAGFPVADLIPSTLRLHNRGVEVALHVVGGQDGTFDSGDFFLFYGQNPRAKYTNTNVYWLTWNEGVDGLRMAEQDGAPAGALPIPSSFTRTVHLEQNLLYRSQQVSGPDLDHWYWSILPVPSTRAKRIGIQFTLDEVSGDPVEATLRGLFKGFSATPHHHTQVLVNNQLVYDAIWPSLDAHFFTARFPQSFLVDGSNWITVVQPTDPAITNDSLFINWFELDYARNYTVANDEMLFLEQAGNWEFQISGFSDDTAQIFDVSSPAQPVRITGSVIELQGASYQARFQLDLAGERQMLALSDSRLRTPLLIFEDTASDLRNTANGADYILITHPDFSAAVQPLADYRASQGYRVQVVDIQDVYDEFSYGLVDPEAVRSFLSYAYANWVVPAPAFVTVVGDGNYDPKNYQGFSPPVFVPPYLADVDPGFGETAADNRFVSVSGSDFLPDMHLGRLPARSAAEATAMVNKIIAYEQNSAPQNWMFNVMFVADNADADGNYPYLSDLIADSHLPAPFAPEKIYYLQTHMTDISARRAITEGINQGRLMVSYVGHGAFQQWAAPMLFSLADVARLDNGSRQPFMFPMTCLEGYYIWAANPALIPDDSSVGEGIVRIANKGAIASFSPAGFGLAEGHNVMGRGLFDAIFLNDVVQLGPATTESKLYLFAETGSYQDLIETYILFGDPATSLPVYERLVFPVMYR